MLPYRPKGCVIPMWVAFLAVPENFVNVWTVLGCVAGFGWELGRIKPTVSISSVFRIIASLYFHLFWLIAFVSCPVFFFGIPSVVIISVILYVQSRWNVVVVVCTIFECREFLCYDTRYLCLGIRYIVLYGEFIFTRHHDHEHATCSAFFTCGIILHREALCITACPL